MKIKAFDQWDNFLGYIKEDYEAKDKYEKNLINSIYEIKDEKERSMIFAAMQAYMLIAEKCVEDEEYAAKYFDVDRNEIELKAKYIMMLASNKIMFNIKEEDS